MTYDYLRLIFFRDLIESQRISIYSAFGYDHLMENTRLNHFIENIFLMQMYDKDKERLQTMMLEYKGEE